MIRHASMRFVLSLVVASSLLALCNHLFDCACVIPSFILALTTLVLGPLTFRFISGVILTFLVSALISYLINVWNALWISIGGALIAVGLWTWLLWIGVVERWKQRKSDST